MTDRPLTLNEAWIAFLLCVCPLSFVAGWIAHGVFR
jgi:hypothetical protein